MFVDVSVIVGRIVFLSVELFQKYFRGVLVGLSAFIRSLPALVSMSLSLLMVLPLYTWYWKLITGVIYSLAAGSWCLR